jgi:hypothetical protein
MSDIFSELLYDWFFSVCLSATQRNTLRLAIIKNAAMERGYLTTQAYVQRPDSLKFAISGCLMETKNWRSALLSALTGEGAQRVLRQPALFQLVTSHRGTTSVSTLHRIKKELIAVNAIFPVTDSVFLNMVCSPQTSYAEAANSIHPESFVSSKTILISEGVISDTKDYVITSVLPDHFFRIFDHETVKGNGASYIFHLLPKEFFPPYLPFNEDVIDQKKLFQCFTAEKAFLDYLYIEKLTRSCISLLPSFDLSRLNIKRLTILAQKIGLTSLLKECLEYQMQESTSYNSTGKVNIEKNVRNEFYVAEILDAIRDVWTDHPDLSFSEVLRLVRPKHAFTYLPNVNDNDWQESLIQYKWKMTKIRDT